MTHWRTARVIDINSGRQSPRGLNKAPPAASRDIYASRGSGISPELMDRVALCFSVAFFGGVAVCAGISAYFISLIIDWDGVGEAAFRIFSFG